MEPRGGPPPGLNVDIAGVGEQPAEAIREEPEEPSHLDPSVGSAGALPSAPEEAAEEEPKALDADDFRRLRRMQKMKAAKGSVCYVSSPGAISTLERDASKFQGRFDMALYKAQLRTDRCCLIVDFATGRVLFSNALCDNLFESLGPLPQRDMADLIYEEDRLNFSATVMYHSLGKYTVMEPQELRVQASQGVQWAQLSGNQLVGSWWLLQIDLLDHNGQA